MESNCSFHPEDAERAKLLIAYITQHEQLKRDLASCRAQLADLAQAAKLTLEYWPHKSICSCAFCGCYGKLQAALQPHEVAPKTLPSGVYEVEHVYVGARNREQQLEAALREVLLAACYWREWYRPQREEPTPEEERREAALANAQKLLEGEG